MKRANNRSGSRKQEFALRPIICLDFVCSTDLSIKFGNTVGRVDMVASGTKGMLAREINTIKDALLRKQNEYMCLFLEKELILVITGCKSFKDVINLEMH